MLKQRLSIIQSAFWLFAVPKWINFIMPLTARAFEKLMPVQVLYNKPGH